MTVFPFPDIPMRTLRMDLDARVSATETLGGKHFVSQRGRPKWVAEIEIPLMFRARSQLLSAWWHQQSVGLNTFTMTHPQQTFPVTYKDGFAGIDRAVGGAFDGTATVTALTTNSISLSGLPADFALNQGDLVGLVESERYGLFEVAADVTGSASGLVTLSVQPFITTSVFTISATANFASPLVEMRVNPGSFDAQRTANAPPATFSARQVSY